MFYDAKWKFGEVFFAANSGSLTFVSDCGERGHSTIEPSFIHAVHINDDDDDEDVDVDVDVV